MCICKSTIFLYCKGTYSHPIKRGKRTLDVFINWVFKMTLALYLPCPATFCQKASKIHEISFLFIDFHLPKHSDK